MGYSEEEVAELLSQGLDPGVEAQLSAAIGRPARVGAPAAALAAIIPHQTEAAHQVNVIKLLHDNGWRVCEFRKARIKKGGKDVYRTPFGADGVGFPDLFAVRPPRAMLVEDKSDTGAASPYQVTWLLLCGKCPPLEVYVVRPEDMEKFKEVVK